jgi:hypothetical protein
MTSLSKEIIDYFDGSTKAQYILRTVKKVTGVPVTAYVTKDFYLCVTSNCRRDMVLVKKKFEGNEDLAKNIYECLKNLKYNKKYDQFENISKHEMESAVFGDEFLDLEKCCVCHEDTIARTDCEHALCLMCENMLKSNSCPVCREPLFEEALG